MDTPRHGTQPLGGPAEPMSLKYSLRCQGKSRKFPEAKCQVLIKSMGIDRLGSLEAPSSGFSMFLAVNFNRCGMT